MLKFIGVGDLLNQEMLNTCAYIKEGNKMLIIDCGILSFKRMLELNLFEDVNEVYIAITHMHPDHVGALASLIFYLNTKNIVSKNIIVPSEDEEQKQNIVNFLSLQGVENDIYNIVKDEDAIIFNDMPKFSYKKIKHTELLKSFAIEMSFVDKKVYYLGDNIDEKYQKSIAKKLGENDLVYTDCCGGNTELHISLLQLANIYDEKVRKQVCCMHFKDDENIDEAKRLGFSVAIKEQSKEEYLKKIMSH